MNVTSIISNSTPRPRPTMRANAIACRRAPPVLITGNRFGARESFVPFLEALLASGQYYILPADLTAYAQARSRLTELCRDREAWEAKPCPTPERAGAPGALSPRAA